MPALPAPSDFSLDDVIKSDKTAALREVARKLYCGKCRGARWN